MLQAPLLDGLAFDLLPFQQNDVAASEVDVGRGEGVRAQVSITDRTAILEGCTEAIEKALLGFPDRKKPEAAIIVSCSARKLLLGTKTSEESRILREQIGQDVPLCGFYSFGEIGPQKTDRTKPIMHHQTFTMLLLGT